MLCYVSLGMNYNNAVSQIYADGYGDGIGIANKVSFFFLEQLSFDNTPWSLESFRKAYEISEIVMLLLLLLFLGAVVFEKRKK